VVQGWEFGVSKVVARHGGRIGAGLIAVTLVGCAPSVYAVQSTHAARAVEQAKRSHAGDHASYELTLAEAYLGKAREESSEAAYQDAIKFARLSRENAEKAIERSRQARTGAVK
jgi:hypothetical protein